MGVLLWRSYTPVQWGFSAGPVLLAEKPACCCRRSEPSGADCRGPLEGQTAGSDCQRQTGSTSSIITTHTGWLCVWLCGCVHACARACVRDACYLRFRYVSACRFSRLSGRDLRQFWYTFRLSRDTKRQTSRGSSDRRLRDKSTNKQTDRHTKILDYITLIKPL